jgi:hypothetical protein
MSINIGDTVSWTVWPDEPDYTGKVVAIDEEYDYVDIRYSTADRVMRAAVPAKKINKVLKALPDNVVPFTFRQ